MKKPVVSLLLAAALLLGLIPAASAADAGLYFGARQVVYRPEEGAVLTLRAVRAPEADIPFTLGDQRGNVYTAVFPAGKTETRISIADSLPEDGSKTIFTLLDGEGYICRTPSECVAVPRGTASFTFGNGLYQVYAGQELKYKLRVENPGSLAAGARIEIRDADGSVLETLEHNPSRTAYTLSFATEESWRPGKLVSVWVEGRDTADDFALMAVGAKGVKAVWGVERQDNKISFTMDCGSHNRYVPAILDILDAYGVKITFFVTGQFAAANPDLVRAMAERGHEVANHSWSHADFDTLNRDEIYSELTRTSDLLEAITGQPVTLFRPPYGHCSSQTHSIVSALGMTPVRWTHESMDARKEASRENSLKFSTRNMQGGSIILTHTSASCTVAVLDQILQFYQDNGFEVVPVSQLLLSDGAYVDEQGIQHPAQ